MADRNPKTPDDARVDIRKELTPQDRVVYKSVMELVKKILTTQEKRS